MKIAYVIDTDISEPNSILTKVSSQTDVWRQLGHTVQIISLRSHAPHTSLQDATICSITNESLIYKIFSYPRAIYRLETILKQYEPDIIYMRYFRYLPALVGVLKRTAPYILEINTDDLSEAASSSVVKQLYCRLTRALLLQESSGMVYVTQELHHNQNFKQFNKPSTIIANGIATSDYQGFQRQISYPLRCVFIGTAQLPWHGVDKIILLAHHFLEYHFDIIGMQAKELKHLKLSKNITFYGALSLQESKQIIQKAVVGIGTLSLYEKQMDEASPLKTRQYLAQGLPVIIGYEDTDLLQHRPDFVLQLPNTPKNIETNLDPIKNFIEAMAHYDSLTISRFAQEHLDVLLKEQRRLSFFKSVLHV
jgi:hypothetical protein